MITAVLNRVDNIVQAVNSVQQQTYSNLEYVVVDGGSTDGTLEVLHRCLDDRATLVSEPDHGIYDALNKGLARASGEIIGLMHSDDFFADENVLYHVAQIFTDPAVDAVYGDLDYVAKTDTNRIIRHWKAGEYTQGCLAWGWMPPHPTLFLRRQVIEQWGGFDTRFLIAADYDAILRYFGQGKIRAAYIPKVLVKMRIGGQSNHSIRRIFLKSYEDYKALRQNNVGGFFALIWKNLSKLDQFLARD